MNGSVFMSQQSCRCMSAERLNVLWRTVAGLGFQQLVSGRVLVTARSFAACVLARV